MPGGRYSSTAAVSTSFATSIRGGREPDGYANGATRHSKISTTYPSRSSMKM